MLTKTDLSSIDKIVKKRVRQEVEAEGKNIRDDSRSELRSTRMRIQEDVRELSDRTKNLEVRTNSLEKEMKKGFKKIEKSLEKTSDFLDREDLKSKKRIKRIEKHLNLKPISP